MIGENEEIAAKIPFAIIGSDHEVQTHNGHSVRGHAYPWGMIEVDNEEHCDFVKLRQMLIRTNMEELREHTNDVLYENWHLEMLVLLGIIQDLRVFWEVKCVLSFPSCLFLVLLCD